LLLTIFNFESTESARAVLFIPFLLLSFLQHFNYSWFWRVAFGNMVIFSTSETHWAKIRGLAVALKWSLSVSPAVHKPQDSIHSSPKRRTSKESRHRLRMGDKRSITIGVHSGITSAGSVVVGRCPPSLWSWDLRPITSKTVGVSVHVDNYVPIEYTCIVVFWN
jgi:hypothetical protein